MTARWALPGLSLLLLSACGASDDGSWQGYVEAEFIHVASSQPGRLDHLYVQRGDTVAAGQALFAFDAENETAAQLQAQRLLSAAEAQLADLQTGKRPAELAVVRAQLTQAEAEAKQAAETLQRDEAQFAAAVISSAQRERSVAAAKASAARVRELRAQLEVAQLGGREQQLAAQHAQVDAARAALTQAQWRLDEKALHSSVAARVVDTLYREGEWIAAGMPVVRLLAPAAVKIRFFVPQTALGALQPGQAIVLQCDGCATGLQATIRYIASEAEYTPPIIYSEQTRAKLVFMIEAGVKPDDAMRLHPGQPVTVRRP